MNGWILATPLETRIANLILQIPQEYRARACQECRGEDDHDFERKLTAYVLHQIWETYESPIAEASRIDAEMGIEQYRAMRKAETAEAVRQMKNGTFRLRPYSSFKRTSADPLTAEEANFYGMDE